MNCLVSKLQGSVSSDLLKIGEVKFLVNASVASAFFSLKEFNYIKSPSPFYVNDSVSSVTEWDNSTPSENVKITPSITGDFQTFIVGGKYSLTEINALLTNADAAKVPFKIDLDEAVGFSSTLANIKISGGENTPENVTGQLNKITFSRGATNYVYVRLADVAVIGDITKDIATYTRSIDLLRCKKIEGLIDNVTKGVNLNTFKIVSCPNIGGTIEGFAEKLISLGKTSGSITIQCGGTTPITYNGVQLDASEHTLTFSGSSYTFS